MTSEGVGETFSFADALRVSGPDIGPERYGPSSSGGTHTAAAAVTVDLAIKSTGQAGHRIVSLAFRASCPTEPSDLPNRGRLARGFGFNRHL